MCIVFIHVKKSQALTDVGLSNFNMTTVTLNIKFVRKLPFYFIVKPSSQT